MIPERVGRLTLWCCPDCPVKLVTDGEREAAVDAHEKQHEGERN